MFPKCVWTHVFFNVQYQCCHIHVVYISTVWSPETGRRVACAQSSCEILVVQETILIRVLNTMMKTHGICRFVVACVSLPMWVPGWLLVFTAITLAVAMLLDGFSAQCVCLSQACCNCLHVVTRASMGLLLHRVPADYLMLFGFVQHDMLTTLHGCRTTCVLNVLAICCVLLSLVCNIMKLLVWEYAWLWYVLQTWNIIVLLLLLLVVGVPVQHHVVIAYIVNTALLLLCHCACNCAAT